MKTITIEAHDTDGDLEIGEIRLDHISAILGDDIHLIGGQIIQVQNWKSSDYSEWLDYVSEVPQ